MIYKNRSLMAPDGTVPMELLEKCIEQHMKGIPRLEKLDVGQRIEGDTNSKLFFRHLSH